MDATVFERPDVYLVREADHMHTLLVAADEYLPDNPEHLIRLRSAASVGCNVLRRVVDDYEFNAVVNDRHARAADDSRIQQFFQERDTDTITRFVELERRIMHQAGMDSQCVEKVITECYRVLFDQRDTNRALNNPSQVRAVVVRLREEACRALDVLMQPEREQIRGLKIKLRVKRTWMGTAATALFCVNYSPLATLNGVTNVFSHISGAVAVAVIDRMAPPSETNNADRQQKPYKR